MSEHMKAEAALDARDASDDRTDLGTRLSERIDNLVEENEGFREVNEGLVGETAQLRTTIRARDVMIDVLLKRIEQMVAAPQPVCAMADGRVVLNDGSVYGEHWARNDFDFGTWTERDPLPRTRRAIALEGARENEADRRARAGATDSDTCVSTEVLEDQAEYRRGARGE